MIRRSPVVVLALSAIGFGVGATRPAEQVFAQAPPTVDFGRDIQPLFQQHCVGCHGSSQQMSGFRLDRRRDAMRGGAAGGVVIRPGNGEISALYLKISGTTFGPQMPPTGALKPEQIAVVKKWIDEGAVWPDTLANDVEPAAPDPGASRLIAAIRSGDRRAFTDALSADSGAINRRGKGGATPLMWAALERNAEAVRALLEAGADVNARNDAGVTALMWAIPDLPIVSQLLERGADPNLKTADGRVPLLRAAAVHGASALVRRLLDAGADPKAQGPSLFATVSALTEAAIAADPDTIRLLLERGVNVAIDGPAPLLFALRANCAACEDLLMKGLPAPLIPVVATLHMPPIGDARHLPRLLELGADVNARDQEGRTMLMLAASSDSLRLEPVQALLLRKADVSAESKAGLTAGDYAALRGNTPILEALMKAGSRPAKPLTMPPPSRAASARAAIERSLPILQKSDATFWKKSGCISCHNNTLTAETIAEARRRAMAFDSDVARKQLGITAGYLEAWRERALQGIGIPGDADTVSYILLGLAAEAHPADAATDAMTRFLLDKQGPDGQWFLLAHRPPIESSVIEVTASSMHALQIYGKRHGATAERAIERAAAWIAKAQPESNEDRAFRLMGLLWAGSKGDAVQAAVRSIKAAQRPDGGWSQLASLGSDAYATGQSLVALMMASGSVPRDDAARRRGLEFLMNTQLADGSWFVRSRALAIQPYFEADFPHGRDQFISAAATNWATRALLLDLP